MSWEEMSRKDYPCNCGKSTYTEIVEMDDWNRRREFRVLHCLDCKKKEISRENRIKIERNRLEELDKEIKNYFSIHYMNDWLTYFTAAKNKKRVWELAKDLGVEKSSLSSFYSRKYSSMEKYIKSLTTYHNMEKIIYVLNINDNNLVCKVEEALKLYKKETDRAINEWYNNN